MPDSNTTDQSIKQNAAPPSVQTDASVDKPIDANKAKTERFPYPAHQFRIQDYDYFARLFVGDHFGAFNILVGDEKYTREYSKLRYVVANLAGLISKIIADMIFSEAPSFNAAEEGGDQDYIDALIKENNLNVQNYESALTNSYMGDAVYKIRVGRRTPEAKEASVIIESINPRIYFPSVDGFNVGGDPKVKELAWVFDLGDKKYLRREVHYVGYYENHIHLMTGEKIEGEVPLDTIPGLKLEPRVDTGINRSLIVHIPNWKTSDRHFGISDYRDLDRLFYAINNRLTAVDNILDKHSDPILMVPPGVLNEKGQVNKKALGVIEIAEGETGKPEYIVWDASLENAFKELEKLTEAAFMIAEISPDILGMGQGQGDSGKAIRMKVMRTIAKAARKKLYYDPGLKEVLLVAQMMGKKHNIKMGGKTLQGEPLPVDIEWQDGLPIIFSEQVEVENQRLDGGTTTVTDSIMRLDGVDKDTAEKKAEEIKKDKELAMPLPTMGNGSFGKPPKPALPPQPTGGGK